MYTLAEIDKIVSNGICALDLKGEPAELYTPIEYMMSIGGKRIRPRLALLACSLFTDKIEPQQGLSGSRTGGVPHVYPDS